MFCCVRRWSLVSVELCFFSMNMTGFLEVSYSVRVFECVVKSCELSVVCANVSYIDPVG